MSKPEEQYRKILLSENINSTSAKNKKAKELGIPIISESELKEKYFN